ncbi:MAG TPA: hypothetical protein VNH64_04060 [Parvularculaceae bacterium]|nr:hypothetical protein [Parvularculaceae bacterium]
MGKLADEPSWSRIGAIGNNIYARLSVAAPIVAPFALYTHRVASFFNDHFSTHINPTGMPWLYVSLISLSAAQFGYNGWSPQEFKEYKSRADYAARGAADLGLGEWETRAIELINLKHASSLLLAANSIDLENLTLPSIPQPDRKERIKGFVADLQKSKRVGPLQGQLLLETLQHCHRELSELGLKKDDHRNMVKTLGLASGKVGVVDQSIIEADLRRLRGMWYDALNQGKPIRRWIVATLYVVGLSFFLWNVPKNILTNIFLLFWPH